MTIAGPLHLSSYFNPQSEQLSFFPACIAERQYTHLRNVKIAQNFERDQLIHLEYIADRLFRRGRR